MRSAVLLATLIGSAYLVLSPPAAAQVSYLWTYEELLQKADLVLIAECQSTSETGRQRPHPTLKPAGPVLELQTVVRVSAVLKGIQAVSVGTDVRIRHYRWSDGVLQGGLINGGSWLRLQPQTNYLLFLMRAADGVYEPLSGHTRPNDSVYLLDSESTNGRWKKGAWCCPTTR